MTDEEKKAWEEIVNIAIKERDKHGAFPEYRNGILWAAAELTRLREEKERLDKVNDLLCKALNEMSNPGQAETLDRALKVMDVVIMGLEIDHLRSRLSLAEAVVEAADKVNAYLLTEEEIMKYATTNFKEFCMKSDIYSLRSALCAWKEKALILPPQ